MEIDWLKALSNAVGENNQILGAKNMKIRTFLLIVFSIVLVFGLNTVSNAQMAPNDVNKQQKAVDDEGDDEVSAAEKKKVKISPARARKIALKRVRGVIVEEELEKENGVGVYSIEIRRKDQKVYDVEVNAKTGAIMKVEEEIDDDEDGEDEAAKKPK